MSVADFLFLNFHEKGKFNELESEMDRIKRMSSAEVIELHEQIDRLSLTCLAMMNLLKEKLGVSDEEISKMIEKVDLLDGKLDGKVNVIAKCGDCNRAISKRHTKCIWCGGDKLTIS